MGCGTVKPVRDTPVAWRAFWGVFGLETEAISGGKEGEEGCHVILTTNSPDSVTPVPSKSFSFTGIGGPPLAPFCPTYRPDLVGNTGRTGMREHHSSTACSSFTFFVTLTIGLGRGLVRLTSTVS